MQELTPEGRAVVGDLAGRYGVSEDAVSTLLRALVAGGGTMAQFNHPELGGMGQWSAGGMVMIGDMFNNALKARVDGLANELAGRLRDQLLLAPSPAVQGPSGQSQSQGAGGVSWSSSGGSFGGWWPTELGQPASTGAQNDIRYAYFPQARRLVLQVGGRSTVYDTGDHAIGGFGQSQGGGAALTFTSQHGVVRLDQLREVAPGHDAGSGGSAGADKGRSGAPSPDTGMSGSGVAPEPPRAAPAAPSPTALAAPVDEGDIFAKIERLAALKAKGLLTDEEFANTKAELLRRL